MLFEWVGKTLKIYATKMNSMDRNEYIKLLYGEQKASVKRQDWEAFWYLTAFLKSLIGLSSPQAAPSKPALDNAYQMGWEDGKSLRDQHEFYEE